MWKLYGSAGIKLITGHWVNVTAGSGGNRGAYITGLHTNNQNQKKIVTYLANLAHVKPIHFTSLWQYHMPLHCAEYC